MTLDPDTAQLVRRRMRERGIGFKEAINDLLREAAAPSTASRFETETASLGRPGVNLDRALQLVGELEDDELIRRMRAGS